MCQNSTLKQWKPSARPMTIDTNCRFTTFAGHGLSFERKKKPIKSAMNSQTRNFALEIEKKIVVN
jgi:hypothetical protein